MKEYWEITQERGRATLAVWQMQPTFALQNLTLAQHTTAVNGLAAAAQTRSGEEADLKDARTAAETQFTRLATLNVRVPGALSGMLAPEDDLHGQLDLVFAEDNNTSQPGVLRRARLVSGVWADFNATRAAATPPQPALTVTYAERGSSTPPATVTQADFAGFITASQNAQQAVADAQRDLSAAKTALRALESKVDRNNKRWYLTWTKLHPAGTPEGDAARSQVPTEQGTPAPTPLEITSATGQPDRTIVLAYDPDGGEHATTEELQWRTGDDPDFGHSTPVVRPTQTVGPFAAGSIVQLRTRVANSTSGVVLSAVKVVGV
ncbi:MAG: hypothetical protein ACOYMN_09675 [Roseimicrobium sp.]